MEINISYISNELNIIIEKHNEYINMYNTEIILYALAAQELINIIKKTRKIPFMFLKIMKYLKGYVNCYIDFDYLMYISRNNIKVMICDDFDNMIYQPSYSGDIFDRINDMLQKDSELLNNVIDNNINSDEYGKINRNVINASKKLFNKMDRDKDGYINALDILYISNICEKYILIFENNFIDVMIQLLISYKYIDYYLFLKNLF